MNVLRGVLIICCLFSFKTVIAQQDTIKKEDAKLRILPNGRFCYDGALYFEDKTPLSNGVGISDLRLGINIEYAKWDGKIDVGFANSEVSLKDIFARYNISESSYIRAGHYFEPFGLDHMEGSGNLKFATPNASTQALSAGRRIGVDYVGWNRFIWFGGGIFGDKDVNNSTKGDDGYAFTGRVVFNALKNDGKIFHIGLAGTYRKPDAKGLDDDGSDSPRDVKYASNAETYIETTKFLSATVDNAENQIKYAVELIGAHGPVHIQSEYIQSFVNRTDNLKTYTAKGAYAQIGVLALGGKYKYTASCARLAPPGAGSLEFVFRYNHTNLNNDKAGIYGGKMNDISIAANYQINKYMAVKLNYVNIKLDDKAPVSGKENFNILQARFQVIF